MKSHAVRVQKPGILNIVRWTVWLLLATFMLLLASRYLTLNPAVFFPEQRAVYTANSPFLLMHIIGAMLATGIGPVQFLPRIRTGRWLNLHRWLGRTYLIGVLIGGLGGLYMAQVAYGGWITRVGFSVLAILWLFSAWMAYKYIRNKEEEKHREWMMRTYSLTFAGISLRLWQLVFHVTGIDFTMGYIIVSWLCWVPNLLIAEILIRRKRDSQHHPARVIRREKQVSE